MNSKQTIMDRETNVPELGRDESFGGVSSAISYLRRRSSGLSVLGLSHPDDDTESESVSEAGDIGDRALHSNRYNRSGRISCSVENELDNSFVVPIQDDYLATNTISSVSPFPLQTQSPISTDAMVQPEERKDVSFIQTFTIGWTLFFLLRTDLLSIKHIYLACFAGN